MLVASAEHTSASWEAGAGEGELRRLAGDAFIVIVPSLPGFALSPQRPEWPPAVPTHELWHRLMHSELGFSRYGAPVTPEERRYLDEVSAWFADRFSPQPCDCVLIPAAASVIPGWSAVKRPLTSLSKGSLL